MNRERHLQRRVPALNRDARIDSVVCAGSDGPVRSLKIPRDEDEVAFVDVPVCRLACEAVPNVDVAGNVRRDDGIPAEPFSRSGNRRNTLG